MGVTRLGSLSEMLMTTELVINWSPGDLVQSLPVLRKLERLSEGDGTSDRGNRSYLLNSVSHRWTMISSMSTLHKAVTAPSYSQSGKR